jgi:4-hydroxybenzoate polyprenyltransferase
MTRWMVYQRERFPLAAHAPLVAAFSASAVCFSSMLRGHVGLPPASSFLVAFVTSLLFFLQLRIADEFKDFAEDSRFRPYRPVPRGLVTLRELAVVGAAAAAVQLALALWLAPPLVWLLLPAWVWFGLMSREFFAARWLRAHPIAYMGSHLLIVPLIDLYATACDWRVAGEHAAPAGLFWFLAVSYLNGMVIELGRKMRAPADEERGVETYSALWGTRGAVRAWLLAILATGAAAFQASARIGTEVPMLLMLVVLIATCATVGERFLRHTTPGRGRWIETMAGLWTVLLYVGLGAVPVLFAAWRGVR